MKKGQRSTSLWGSIRSTTTSRCGQKLALRYTRIPSLTLATCKCKTSFSEADLRWWSSSPTLATGRGSSRNSSSSRQILLSCRRYASITTPIIWITAHLTTQTPQSALYLAPLLSKTSTPETFQDSRTRSTFLSPITATQAYLWTGVRWTMETSWCNLRTAAATTTSCRLAPRWLRAAAWIMDARRRARTQRLIPAWEEVTRAMRLEKSRSNHSIVDRLAIQARTRGWTWEVCKEKGQALARLDLISEVATCRQLKAREICPRTLVREMVDLRTPKVQITTSVKDLFILWRASNRKEVRLSETWNRALRKTKTINWAITAHTITSFTRESTQTCSKKLIMATTMSMMKAWCQNRFSATRNSIALVSRT